MASGKHLMQLSLTDIMDVDEKIATNSKRKVGKEYEHSSQKKYNGQENIMAKKT